VRKTPPKICESKIRIGFHTKIRSKGKLILQEDKNRLKRRAQGFLSFNQGGRKNQGFSEKAIKKRAQRKR